MNQDDVGLQEMVSILGRRGQTIYGRHSIVETCAKAGVTLVEDPDDERLDENSQESLERFLLEYAKLGPAAKLTLLVLSKQYETTLPAEITRKKKSLVDLVSVLSDFVAK
ncbi:MAG: hypothetical protein RTU09_08630 [Candidatus Thorarchaeota archaeon]